MKKFIIFCTLSIILTSCSTSNHVVKEGSFQKRKYTSGWFIKKKGQSSDQEANSTAQTRTIHSEEANRNETVATLTKKANNRTAERKEYISYSTHQAETNAAVGLVRVEKELTDERPKGGGSDHKVDVAETVLASNLLGVNDTNTEQNTVGFLQLLDVKHLLVQQRHSENSSTQSSEESSNSDLLFILTVVLCFILPPLAVYIFTEDLTQTLLNLLLTLLFIIPGVVHALLVVFGKL